MIQQLTESRIVLQTIVVLCIKLKDLVWLQLWLPGLWVDAWDKLEWDGRVSRICSLLSLAWNLTGGCGCLFIRLCDWNSVAKPFINLQKHSHAHYVCLT